MNIQDDGKGIDPEEIRFLAKKKFDLEKMSPEEIISLIFEPGFSSKQEVTSISGRGVGLDAVKEEVDRLGGKITVSSKVDEGTMFTIELPIGG
ncbi:MAG: ATP-binding protein [Bdellovibrionota bacterium]|nr:ATP-binding protein [Bdellovibrionota bacterium]